MAINEAASWEQIIYAKVGIKKQTNSKKKKRKADNKCKYIEIVDEVTSKQLVKDEPV